MEMETESEEEEDGQISKLEEQEERDRRLYGQPMAPDETATWGDLSKCQVTRSTLVRHYTAPWFAAFCKGTHPPYSHFRSEPTASNANRRLGEILYRNQPRSTGLSYLRDHWPCGHT